MPRNIRKEIINAKKLINNTDSILIITGAGMSVDSGIPTYRGVNGIWTKNIKIGDDVFSYDEISSLKMWKEYPKLAWGFKSHFYHIMNSLQPHDGYYKLLENIKDKFDYFICTSNIDGYFKRSGFDEKKIYEVHGSINNLQCMDKKCNILNGITTAESYPSFNKDTLIADWLPKCKFCNKMSRPNVSMFGDVEFYGKPYEYQRKRLNDWLIHLKKYNKKLIILEIGCGINPHSIRMSNGKMMSGEWKMPIFDNNIGTIRLNPSDEQQDVNTIHINMGAKQGIYSLFT
jgi:NAD-dependent SIR2 family protein deacetylase